jgi:hypothetical protein
VNDPVANGGDRRRLRAEALEHDAHPRCVITSIAARLPEALEHARQHDLLGDGIDELVLD